MAQIPPDPTKYGITSLPYQYQFTPDLALVSLPPDLPLWYPTDPLDHIVLPNYNYSPMLLPVPAFVRTGPWIRRMFKSWNDDCLLRYDPNICGI